MKVVENNQKKESGKVLLFSEMSSLRRTVHWCGARNILDFIIQRLNAALAGFQIKKKQINQM